MLYFCSSKKDRRFLVIDVLQLILVEPDSKRLGWGVVRFVGFLQVCLPVLLAGHMLFYGDTIGGAFD